MAKSIRSKSKRKTRAVKYAGVFKSVEESRTNRLSSKLLSLPSSEAVLQKLSGGDVVMDLADQQPLVRTGQRNKTVGFNMYGMGKRELKF
jgi:hypothetical protein